MSAGPMRYSKNPNRRCCSLRSASDRTTRLADLPTPFSPCPRTRGICDDHRIDRIGHGFQPMGSDLVDRHAHPHAVDIRIPATTPTATSTSYLWPLPSTMFVKRNPLRSSSDVPPQYCQRTNGCNTVSLLTGASISISKPQARSASKCPCMSMATIVGGAGAVITLFLLCVLLGRRGQGVSGNGSPTKAPS